MLIKLAAGYAFFTVYVYHFPTKVYILHIILVSITNAWYLIYLAHCSPLA